VPEETPMPTPTPPAPVPVPDDEDEEDGEGGEGDEGDEGDETPQEPAATQAQAEVEPMLGFAEFVSTQPMRQAAQAALRRWMQMQRQEPDGHYPLATWREAYQGMLAHH
jgi:hypothetical protein